MSKIIGAYIEITGICNERCPYCYNAPLVERGESLPLHILIRLLDELYALGKNSVTFSGGEPFLYEDIGELLRYANEKGIQTSVISNGTCFDDKNIELLLRCQPVLQITFDGYNAAEHDRTRGSGNFEKISGGIVRARKAGLKSAVNIRINLHKKNVNHLSGILSMLASAFDLSGADADISSISLAIVHKTERGGGNFEDYLQFGECARRKDIFDIADEWNNSQSVQIQHDLDAVDLGCAYNADKSDIECSLRIAADGMVYPCQLFTDEQFSIGNIYNSGLTDILSGAELAYFAESVQERNGKIERCNLCAYQTMCGRGCPALAYIENGTLLSVTERCPDRKSHFADSLTNILAAQRKK